MTGIKKQRSYWITAQEDLDFQLFLADINTRLTNGAKLTKSAAITALVKMTLAGDITKTDLIKKAFE